ncbi:MAG: proline--tRNA ligase [Dehalococcoidia bacterium]|nr:proline--tRNA ligase [Dehalococcoidia bacterium]
MRMSHLFAKTLRQAPAEADTPNHQLMLRAGLAQQLAAGVYSYLPVGWRVMRKIEQIIREEMDRAGGQEIMMPAIQPAELWADSGRLATMADVLVRFQDRRERDFVLGPTHEEVVVDLFKRQVQSYRDMPILVYQIQTKFRDEARPRGGLMRVREFTMKDAYSFDTDWDALDANYQAARAAYTRIFDRCGVPTVPVLADSGAIGGKDSEEFMYLTEVGEDMILLCPGCGYAANEEKADHKKHELPFEEPRALEEVATPGRKTIEQLVEFLGVPPYKTLKAVFYEADGAPVFVAIRGDLEVNEAKLRNALKAPGLALLDDEGVRKHGLVAGSASPVGLTGVRVVADDSALQSPNLVAGANKHDAHYRNVNYGRDWTASVVADISLARAGSPCPRCGTPLETRRGMEMGHVFKLGTVYTERLQASYTDEAGALQPAVMGCYGIGVGRVFAGAIEANHDERGIIWPPGIAPYDVHLTALGLDKPGVRESAEQVYRQLQDAGYAVLFDDREDLSAGVKFNDADLLGMPLRVTVSPRSIESGGAELKHRSGKDAEVVALADVPARAGAVLAALGSRK